MRRSLWAVELTHTPLENLVAHYYASGKNVFPFWLNSPHSIIAVLNVFDLFIILVTWGKKYLHANGRIKKLFSRVLGNLFW
jgi:hypothetical protein